MKYVIDVPEEMITSSGELMFHYKNTKDLTYQMYTGINAEPYTEPDRKTIEDAQNQGWKFANDIINGLNIYERRECFGYGLLPDILNSMSYQEAVDHFEIWKTERNDLIKVGDELKSTLYEDYRIVVFEDKDNCYEGLGIKGNMVFHAVWQKNHNYEKTGRHFSQVTDLLKVMKGECDEVSD